MHQTIVLVRHGHVEGIDIPHFRGRQHLQLTAPGLQQAEQTASYLSRLVRPDVVISPLTRCITTASIIGRSRGLVPIPDEKLIDLDFGEWQGRSYSDVLNSDRERAESWFSSPHTAEISGGETLDLAFQRVTEAMTDILSRRAGQTVILVGHDTTNRLILLNALGMDLSRYEDLVQDPCGVSRLLRDSGRWVVQSVNETARLMPALGHTAAD
jgi:phosphoserine phosphatase